MSYMQYRGRCIGRIMSFLYQMDKTSDSWARIDGKKQIFYHDTLFASYEYLGDTDIPVFKFEKNFEQYSSRMDIAYVEVLRYDDGVFSQSEEDQSEKTIRFYTK